jgi:hypothetical protein
MRYCIEHIFYALVPHYKAELPDDVVDGKVWRPAEIIDMIADIDPLVQHDSILRIGRQKAPGEAATSMVEIGRQSGISKDLIRKVYHKLGYYLHARVDRASHDPEHLRKRLLKLFPYLEKFEGDTSISAIAERVHFNCTLCSRPIAKRTEHLTRDRFVKCPNSRCGAVYEHVDGTSHKLLQHAMKCEVCEKETWFAVHMLQDLSGRGGLVECCECKTQYRLERWIMFKRVNPNADKSTSPEHFGH